MNLEGQGIGQSDGEKCGLESEVLLVSVLGRKNRVKAAM